MSTKRSELQVCVMTSGGDSQGMNAAIRAIVRRGLLLGAHLFGIFWEILVFATFFLLASFSKNFNKANKNSVFHVSWLDLE